MVRVVSPLRGVAILSLFLGRWPFLALLYRPITKQGRANTPKNTDKKHRLPKAKTNTPITKQGKPQAQKQIGPRASVNFHGY